MKQAESQDAPENANVDLAEAIRTARRGFRRDTEALVERLDTGVIFVAMAEPVDDTADDTDELKVVPHLTRTDGGQVLFPAFTAAERLQGFATQLQWSTRGDELSYCSLSLRAAFDVAIELAAGKHVAAMVIDPGDEHELLLRPNEVAELRQGHAIPLVGYVSALPPEKDERTLVSELAEPPNEALVRALDECVRGFPALTGYRLEQTFNRERDLEPHPTLVLELAEGTDQNLDALRARLGEIFEGALPAPGYIDVVFEEEESRP